MYKILKASDKRIIKNNNNINIYYNKFKENYNCIKTIFFI